jgi:hypothetical protein
VPNGKSGAQWKSGAPPRGWGAALIGSLCVLDVLDAASTNQAQQDHDNRNDEQYVDEAANGVRSDQAQQPQDEQNYSDGIEHESLLKFVIATSNVGIEGDVEPLLLVRILESIIFKISLSFCTMSYITLHSIE